MKKKNAAFLKSIVEQGYSYELERHQEHVRSAAEEIYRKPPVYLYWTTIRIWDEDGQPVIDSGKFLDQDAAVKFVRKEWYPE